MEKLEDILKLLLKWYIKFAIVSFVIAIVCSLFALIVYLLFNHFNF